MTSNVSNAGTDKMRLAIWFAVLIGASVLFSLGLACAMPFAAVGALAAMHLTTREALMLTAIAWVANQAVGFGILNYPHAPDTYLWGAALLAAALTGMLTAVWIVARLRAAGMAVAAAVAFIGAFAAYEVALMAVGAATASGSDAFTPKVVGQVFLANASAFGLLLLLHWIAVAMGVAPAATRQAAAGVA